MPGGLVVWAAGFFYPQISVTMNHKENYKELFGHDPDLYKHRLNDLLTWDRDCGYCQEKIAALNELIRETKVKKVRKTD